MATKASRIELGTTVPEVLADYKLEPGALVEFFYVAPQGPDVVAAVAASATHRGL